MCAASFLLCHLVNVYGGVKSGWSCGWQVKLCGPVNTCQSVALRDCLGRKNALYKYLILYILLFSVWYGFCNAVFKLEQLLRRSDLKKMCLAVQNTDRCIHSLLPPSKDKDT